MRSTFKFAAAAMSSKVEGAARPSRCSAMTRTPPAIRSPPHEALLPQELREPLRLLRDRPRDHLRAALRDGRGQPYDSARALESERALRGLDVFRDVRLDTTRVNGRFAPDRLVVRSLAVVPVDFPGTVVGAAAWPGSPPPVPVMLTVPVMLGWTSQW